MTRKRWRLVSDDESGDVFSAAVGIPVASDDEPADDSGDDAA